MYLLIHKKTKKRFNRKHVPAFVYERGILSEVEIRHVSASLMYET